MYSLIIFLSICVFTARSTTHYHYISDFSTIGDKMKMKSITKELIMDAFMKIRQVADIRDQLSGSQPFQVGIIMGNIREKYRRMLETYRELRDRFNGDAVFVPAAVWTLKPIHYIIAMEQVHGLEVDIDKSVHVLETIKDKALNPDPRYLHKIIYPVFNRPFFYPRAKTDATEPTEIVSVDPMLEMEESLKRKNREEQLLRRLGATVRHTSLPRFKHQWPVEDTWRLGQYGDLKRYYR